MHCSMRAFGVPFPLYYAAQSAAFIELLLLQACLSGSGAYPDTL